MAALRPQAEVVIPPGPLRADDVAAICSHVAETARTGRGRSVFVAGDGSDGRAEVLADAAIALRDAKDPPVVARGRLAGGAYAAAPEPEGQRDALDTAEELAKASGSLLGPAGGLVAQLLSLTGAGRRLWRDIAASGERVDQLTMGTLRVVSRDRPLTVLVDDVHEAGGRWWNTLLLAWAHELTEIPVTLVLGLQGPARLGAPGDAEPDERHVARRLVARGLAAWHGLDPLDAGDVRAWLQPVDPGVCVCLWRASAGQDVVVRGVWAEWQRRGAVTDETGVWRFAGASGEQEARRSLLEHVVSRIERALGTADPRSVEIAQHALTLGALQGRVFTTDVVADVLSVGRDEVVDLFDDRLGDVVAEVRPATVTEPATGVPVHLCRHEFRDAWVWLVLRDHALASEDRRRLATALANALAARYQTHVGVIATTLANVLAMAGRPADAAAARRRAAVDERAETLSWQADWIMAEDMSGWPIGDRRRAMALLLEAVGATQFAVAAAVSLDRTRRAHDLARELGEQWAQLVAAIKLAQLAQPCHELSYALERADEALTLARALNHDEALVQALAARGTALRRLGQDGARAAFEEAVAITAGREGSGEFALLRAGALANLGALDREAGRLANARSRFEEAGRLSHPRSTRVRPSPEAARTHATVASEIALLDLVERRFADARDRLQLAEHLFASIGDLHHEGDALLLTGLAELGDDRPEAAAAYGHRAERLFVRFLHPEEVWHAKHLIAVAQTLHDGRPAPFEGFDEQESARIRDNLAGSARLLADGVPRAVLAANFAAIMARGLNRGVAV